MTKNQEPTEAAIVESLKWKLDPEGLDQRSSPLNTRLSGMESLYNSVLVRFVFKLMAKTLPL